jgi:hypothetical protein
MVPGAMEQTESRAAQHTADAWPLSQVDQAGILPQAHIPGALAPILDHPVPSFQVQEPAGGPDWWWQTGNGVAHLLLALAPLPPDPFDADELGDTRPVGQSQGIGGGPGRSGHYFRGSAGVSRGRATSQGRNP